MIPPHLPAPSCSIETHQKWQRVKLIAAVTCISLVAGVTGASMMIGWIWPMSGDAEKFTVSYYRSAVVHKQLADRILQEVRSRIVRVYSESVSANGVVYAPADRYVGDAYVVSSDGWLALYAPDYNGVFKNWHIITAEGTSVSLEKAVYDARTGLLFLKVPTNASRYFTKQAEFIDTVKEGDDVFVNEHGLWNYSIIDHKKIYNELVPHSDAVQSVRYVLNNTFASGSLVITSDGRVVGMVTRGKHVLPSSVLTNLLSSILSKGTVTYTSLGVEGWFDAEAPVLVNNVAFPGFFVDHVTSKQSLLKRGDVIVSINDEVVDPFTMWYTIKNNKEVRLKVFRAGKTISIVAPVLQL